jgi:hypothetical protein
VLEEGIVLGGTVALELLQAAVDQRPGHALQFGVILTPATKIVRQARSASDGMTGVPSLALRACVRSFLAEVIIPVLIASSKWGS